MARRKPSLTPFPSSMPTPDLAQQPRRNLRLHFSPPRNLLESRARTIRCDSRHKVALVFFRMRIELSPGQSTVVVKFLKTLGRITVVFTLAYLAMAAYQSQFKPLPPDVSLAGERHPLADSDVEFLTDTTALKGGQRFIQQELFDRALKLIREAEDFIVIDLFLFNNCRGKDAAFHRPLCQELTDALLNKKRTRPQIRIVVISDPINEVYGGAVSPQFNQLRAAWIPVVLTRLEALRDSNPIYSTFWRIGVQWFGNRSSGALPHPFSTELKGVTLRSWLALLNFKANHRKVIVADAPKQPDGREIVALVMSANPHDASSAHGNAGLFVRGGVCRDLIRAEGSVLRLSGSTIDLGSWIPPYAAASERTLNDSKASSGTTARVLTEGKIRDGILEALGQADAGSAIDIAMFYLSERRILGALADAAGRGVSVRLLLDPNRDAFGYEKNGIPNRPAAEELFQTWRWEHLRPLARKRTGNNTPSWSS